MNQNNRKLKAVVLAAGMGKRMRGDGGDIPKVMRHANGRPLLAYTLEALNFIPKEDIVIVVGYRRELIIEAFHGYGFAVQEEQLGTGHAAKIAMDELGELEGDILVCCGDMPLIRRETYSQLCREHGKSGFACTMLTGVSSIALPYGRVLRGADGSFIGIREERDCSLEELAIRELNSGVYVFDAHALREALGALRPENSQGEYYLTDAPNLIEARGGRVGVHMRELGSEIIGVNTPDQLKTVEDALNAANKI